jgi:short subunit dehydrogenase-like uncharacterized protein
MDSKKFDIIVFGATSFVGQILCRYLHQHLAGTTTAWAMAGRSESKLKQFRAELALSAPACQPESIEIIVADAQDEAALTSLCQQTRVVVSTVGPYALYGETLVKACVDTGTDYCDLTGEVQWIRRMIIRYEQAAKASGARIVHCCGFDSIPSDMGVYFLQQQADQQFGSYCSKVKMRVKNLKGGASGGTIASMINVVKEAAADADLRRELADPYSICSPGHGLKATQHAITVEYDEDVKSWVAPFIMSGINTRIVHRSNALLNAEYGTDFSYDEGMLTGDGNKGRGRARRLTWALNMFMLAAALRPSRWLVQKFLPKPGQGPSPQAQEQGYFDLLFMGTTASGQTLHTKVHGDRDPGYGATGRMLGQAALCLAHDVSKSEKAGGFWTPSTLFADKLIIRLEQHADVRFELLP